MLGYYAALMEFTPVGLPDPAARWEVGGDVTYLPPLSLSDRLVGFGGTKAEDTNLCPVFPRLRASLSLGAWAIEAGWVPPVGVCHAQADMVSGAVLRRFPLTGPWGAGLRASVHYGTLRAAITCDAAAVADPGNETCFGGRVSDDRIIPFTLALDGLLTFHAGGVVEPYLLLGVRRDAVRFDVHYQTPWGPLDQQRLTATLTRVELAAGAAWRAAPPIRLGGELYYAPGAVLTVRFRAAYAFGRTR